MAKRQKQIKQVWFTDEDEKAFERVAKALIAHGVDLEPESRRSASPYSYTKLVRYLLHEWDATIK